MDMRRSPAALIGLLVTGLLLAACTSSSSTSPTSSPTSAATTSVSMAPSACPPDVSKQLGKNDVAGDTDTLVPDDPSGLVLCEGHTRIVVDAELVPELTSILNGLERVQSPSTAPCRLDLGPIYGLYFNYPDASVLAVSVESAGCRFASNGKVTAHTNAGLIAQIQALTGTTG